MFRHFRFPIWTCRALPWSPARSWLNRKQEWSERREKPENRCDVIYRSLGIGIANFRRSFQILLTMVYSNPVIPKVCSADHWWSANPYIIQYFVLRGPTNFSKWSANQKSLGFTALTHRFLTGVHGSYENEVMYHKCHLFKGLFDRLGVRWR